MTAPTVVWGPIADQFGHTRWVGYERSADGRGARSVETWAEEPADDYASWHPSPMEARWCHGSVIGRVIALRRQHGKLFAVAELGDEVTPDMLDELTARNGPLR